MTATALDHPLVRAYLEQLNRALVRLPTGEAAELRQQIHAHLREALPDEPDEAAVRPVLDGLGSPADLVREAATLRAASVPSLRERLGRISPRARVAVLSVIVVVTAVIVTSVVLIGGRTRAGALVCLCGVGWSDPRDSHAQVTTEANDNTQMTVPMRTDGTQGIDVWIQNPTHVTQTVLGLPTEDDGARIGPFGPTDSRKHYRLRMTTSGGPNSGMTSRGLSGHFPMAIPPGGERTVRLQWSGLTCYSPGITVLINEVALKVRAGGSTRVETIQLGMTFGVQATRTLPCPRDVVASP